MLHRNERKDNHSDQNCLNVDLGSTVRVECSDDDVRVIVIDSIIPTDDHIIQDSRKRESKLERLLKKKFLLIGSSPIKYIPYHR